jgi:hypothetical protein
MGKVYDGITPELESWIAQQHVFFVATAPLSGDGLVNCSPKGMDSLRILGRHDVAYVDMTGSGIETVAHVRENGRIAIMLCAFDGPPKIVRLQGTGRVIEAGTEEFELLRTRFPEYPGTRAIIRVSLSRVADSCGYSVPRMEYVEDRDTLVRWAVKKGPEALDEYRSEKNALSLDGLPGLQQA